MKKLSCKLFRGKYFYVWKYLRKYGDNGNYICTEFIDRLIENSPQSIKLEISDSYIDGFETISIIAYNRVIHRNITPNKQISASDTRIFATNSQVELLLRNGFSPKCFHIKISPL